MYPIKNARITQEYGRKSMRYKKGYHTGIDMTGDKEVRSIGSGVILRSEYAAGRGADPDGWGNYVIVRQHDGHDVLYAHLDKTLISLGQTVTDGDTIGVMGSTGNSTGPHLHFEVRKGDWRDCRDIDPAEYLGIKNEVGPIERMNAMEKISIKKEGEVYEGCLIDGVAFGPIRDLFQSQGQDVLWYASEKKVVITSGPLERLREIKRLVEGVR